MFFLVRFKSMARDIFQTVNNNLKIVLKSCLFLKKIIVLHFSNEALSLVIYFI